MGKSKKLVVANSNTAINPFVTFCGVPLTEHHFAEKSGKFIPGKVKGQHQPRLRQRISIPVK